MKYLADQRAPEFFAALAEKAELFIPAVEEGIVNFRRGWNQEAPLSGLREKNTVLSPKDLFFPQTESIFRYTLSDGEFKIESEMEEQKKRLIVGVRACDLRSFQLLDRVFLSGEYRDEHYAKRREETSFITLSCTKAQETCFCTAFDLDPGRPEGGVLRFTDLEDGFAVEVTGEDEEVLSLVKGTLTDLNEDKKQKVENLQLKARDQIKLKPEIAGIENLLKDRFEDPLFDEYASRCLGCGICTYLCPTCHCYDLESEGRGSEGVRFRCWDSCMFSNFTRLAGGENPRPTRRERIRNRFMHKLEYFPERYGAYGCTGCGRCLNNCPVNVDITDFVRRIREVKVDE